MIGFQKGNKFDFSLFNEGDNNVFSPLRSENYLFINLVYLLNNYERLQQKLGK